MTELVSEGWVVISEILEVKTISIKTKLKRNETYPSH